MNRKQWIKIAVMAAPIIAMVIAILAGLDESAQKSIEDVILMVITIVGGAIGVTGVVMNNDKNGNGIDDSQE